MATNQEGALQAGAHGTIPDDSGEQGLSSVGFQKDPNDPASVHQRKQGEGVEAELETDIGVGEPISEAGRTTGMVHPKVPPPHVGPDEAEDLRPETKVEYSSNGPVDLSATGEPEDGAEPEPDDGFVSPLV